MGSKPPFEFLGPLARFVLIWVGVVLVGFGGLTISRLERPDLEACRTKGDCVQLSIAAMEFAWDAADYAPMKAWSDATRKRTVEALRADSWMLVPGYVLVLGILCGAAARRGDQRSYRGPGVAIAWLVFVGGAADLAENTLMAMALEQTTGSGPSGGVLTALMIVVIAKWVLVMAALVYATLAPLSRYAMGRG